MAIALAKKPKEEDEPRDESILSASQIEKFECERRGGFHYLLGIRDEGTTDTETGGWFHRCNEAWLKEGATPETTIARLRSEGENIDKDRETLLIAMVMATMPHLPRPKSPGVLVEGDFTFTYEGVQYTGAKDLEYWKRGLVVYDHKSCGNFKYVKSPKVLLTDVQAILYAAHAFQKHTEVNELEARWGYTTKEKQPRYQASFVTLHRSHVEAEMARIREKSLRILEIKRTAQRTLEGINRLKANTARCGDFRGCKYQKTGDCKLTAANRVFGAINLFNKKVGLPMAMSFQDIMAAKAKAKAEAAGAASAPQTVVRKDEKEDSTLSGVTRAEVDAVAAAKPAGGTLKEKMAAAGINPEPIPSAPVGQKPTPPTEEQKQEATASVAHSLDGEAPKVDPEPKARGGRPKGAKNKPKEAKVYTAEDAGKVMAEEADDSEDLRGISVPTGRYALFIDCRPRKSDYQILELATVLAPVHAALAEQHGMAHYSQKGYGEGPGMFVMGLNTLLSEQAPASDTAIVVHSATAEASLVLNTLIAHAGIIVDRC